MRKTRLEKRPWLAGAMAMVAMTVASRARADEVNVKRFNLAPNPAVVRCLAAYPDDPSRPPSATVLVKRGKLNDELDILLRNVKPGLAFDLFTVERTSLRSDGTVDPEFKANGGSFGLAWYQSDLQASPYRSVTSIHTVLVDQIFGFDSAIGLPPTNTFHVGFWFNSPADAAECGFTGSTPFNGEHDAGPLAMISVPDPVSELGPLCFKPGFSTDPPHCHP